MGDVEWKVTRLEATVGLWKLTIEMTGSGRWKWIAVKGSRVESDVAATKGEAMTAAQSKARENGHARA